MTVLEEFASRALAGLLSAGFGVDQAVPRAIEAAEKLQEAMTRKYWPAPQDGGLDV